MSRYGKTTKERFYIFGNEYLCPHCKEVMKRKSKIAIINLKYMAASKCPNCGFEGVFILDFINCIDFDEVQYSAVRDGKFKELVELCNSRGETNCELKI